MKFKPILIILFIIICAGNFSPIQAENNESIINHNVTSTENIGFFYEVYAPDSQNLAGYIFGVVHPLTKKYAKKVLSLNPLMEKAFNSSTIYLPEDF